MKKSLMRRENILIISVVFIFCKPFKILINVICRYKNGHKKLKRHIKSPARELLNKKVPQKFPKNKKNKVHPNPNKRLKVMDFCMVYFIFILLLVEEASETEGSSNTEAELTKVEGNNTKLNAIPVKTP